MVWRILDQSAVERSGSLPRWPTHVGAVAAACAVAIGAGCLPAVAASPPIAGEGAPTVTHADMGNLASRGPAPSVRVSNAPDTPERRAPTSAVFTVRLDRPTERTVAVGFTTKNGTAAAGTDYRRRSGVLVWAPGEQVKRVRVRVLADSRRELTEAFRLRLVAPGPGLVISDGTGSARIIDDDIRRQRQGN